MKEAILQHLSPDFPWRDRIHWLEETASTNDIAKIMADDGAPSGTVIFADRQTGGRGRMGRSFHSPKGSGIYMSLILRPRCKPLELMHLTCAVATAACDGVEQATGLRPGIKWTNDLVQGTRKLGGILTELALEPGTGLVRWAIIGIGINCTQKAQDFPEEIRSIAGSLAMVCPGNVDRWAVCGGLLTALEQMDRTLLTQVEETLNRYRRDCITLGKDISLVRGDEVRHGHALDIDPEGGLIVRFSDGQVQTVSSGEVSVRGMYGYI